MNEVKLTRISGGPERVSGMAGHGDKMDRPTRRELARRKKKGKHAGDDDDASDLDENETSEDPADKDAENEQTGQVAENPEEPRGRHIDTRA